MNAPARTTATLALLLGALASTLIAQAGTFERLGRCLLTPQQTCA